MGPSTDPGILAAEPGILAAEPGILAAEPATLAADPGILAAEPGILAAEPGILAAEPAPPPAQTRLRRRLRPGSAAGSAYGLHLPGICWLALAVGSPRPTYLGRQSAMASVASIDACKQVPIDARSPELRKVHGLSLRLRSKPTLSLSSTRWAQLAVHTRRRYLRCHAHVPFSGAPHSMNAL